MENKSDLEKTIYMLIGAAAFASWVFEDEWNAFFGIKPDEKKKLKF